MLLRAIRRLSISEYGFVMLSLMQYDGGLAVPPGFEVWQSGIGHVAVPYYSYPRASPAVWEETSAPTRDLVSPPFNKIGYSNKEWRRMNEEAAEPDQGRQSDRIGSYGWDMLSEQHTIMQDAQSMARRNERNSRKGLNVPQSSHCNGKLGPWHGSPEREEAYRDHCIWSGTECAMPTESRNEHDSWSDSIWSSCEQGQQHQSTSRWQINTFSRVKSVRESPQGLRHEMGRRNISPEWQHNQCNMACRSPDMKRQTESKGQHQDNSHWGSQPDRKAIGFAPESSPVRNGAEYHRLGNITSSPS